MADYRVLWTNEAFRARVGASVMAWAFDVAARIGSGTPPSDQEKLRARQLVEQLDATELTARVAVLATGNPALRTEYVAGGTQVSAITDSTLDYAVAKACTLLAGG